jgi:hypothetical protein
MGRQTFHNVMAVVVTGAFLVSDAGSGFAAMAGNVPWMPEPGTRVGLTPAFTPARLTGMAIKPDQPFRFDFFVAPGDTALRGEALKAESGKLIRYFLAALAIPDTHQWVNLSPFEKDRIVTDDFGRTAMGRDVLAQDYLLKQIASSLTDPDSDLGRRFWDNVYAEAAARFGTTEVPTDVFSKVWITPDRAEVVEKDNAVYIVASYLKVMTDTDHTAMSGQARRDAPADISVKVMREVILPALEKEVNEGTAFAPLRQIYSGMILATWYKMSLKSTVLGRLYADQGKVKGIDQDPRVNEEIYRQYLLAYQKGAVSLIREDMDRLSGEPIPRRYFAGGFDQDIVGILKTYKKEQGIPKFWYDIEMLDSFRVTVEFRSPEAALGFAEYLKQTPDERIGRVKVVEAKFTLSASQKRILAMAGLTQPGEKVGSPGETLLPRELFHNYWARLTARPEAHVQATETLRALKNGAALNAKDVIEALVHFVPSQHSFLMASSSADFLREVHIMSLRTDSLMAGTKRERVYPFPELNDVQEFAGLIAAADRYMGYTSTRTELASLFARKLSFKLHREDLAMKQVTAEGLAERWRAKTGNDSEYFPFSYMMHPEDWKYKPVPRVLQYEEVFEAAGILREILGGQASLFETMTRDRSLLRSRLLVETERALTFNYRDRNPVVNGLVYSLADDAGWILADRNSGLDHVTLVKALELLGMRFEDRHPEFVWIKHERLTSNTYFDELEIQAMKRHDGTLIYFLPKDKNPAVSEAPEPDHAQTGGIDLAQSHLDLLIRRDKAGLMLPVEAQDLERIRINGLVPRILDISPTAVPLQ